jgi:hypothetical protein
MFDAKTPNPMVGYKGTDKQNFESRPTIRTIEKFSGNKPDTPWGISDVYVVLDSFEKIETSNTRNGELKFNLGSSRYTQNQVIGMSGDLYRIIDAKIGAFTMPVAPKLPYITNDNVDQYGVPQAVPNSDLPRLTENGAPPEDNTNLTGSSQSTVAFGGRLSLEMVETNAQSIIGLNNTNFHFELVATNATYLNQIEVEPIRGWETFEFTKPINSLTNLTVNIRNPDTGVFLSPDVLYNVEPFITENTAGIPVLAFRVKRQNHNLTISDQVYIRYTDFTNGESDTIFQKYDKWINDTRGHLIGIGTTSSSGDTIMDTIPSETVIRLNPDLNLYDIVQSNPTKYYVGKVLTSATKINIAIAKNRIRIPIRFRRILNEITNYKNP